MNKFVTTDESNYLPINCPSCNQSLLWEGVDLVCKNIECQNIGYSNLRIWVKNIAEVEGISEILIFKFFDELNISSLKDLYSKSYNELIYKDVEENSHKGKFNQVLNKLFNETIDFHKLLMALNIKMLGVKNANKLANNLEFAKVFTELFNANFENCLFPIDLVKQLIGNVFSETIFNAENIKKLKNTKYAKGRIHIDIKQENNIEQIPVVITGKLSMKRKDFEMLLDEHNYIVKNNITKDIKYLICNELSNSTKSKRAIDLGITIISEVDILKIINNA